MIQFAIETDIARPPGERVRGRHRPEQARFAVHGQASGMMRLAAPVMRPVLRRQFAGYCANLKRILENGSP
jgi:hypothetical protein